MKKIIFVIAFLSTLSLNAQHAWRVGDTVQGRYTRDTDYFYQWWCDSVDRDAPLLLDVMFLGPVDGWRVRYNYTDRPLRIAGLAACFYFPDWILDSNGFPPDSIMTLPEYLLLFDATPDSFALKAQVPIQLSIPHRYMSFYNHSPTGCCERYFDRPGTHHLYEYYFDKPITVEDSFYVGGTNHNGTAIQWVDHGDTSYAISIHTNGPLYYGSIEMNRYKGPVDYYLGMGYPCDTNTCPYLPDQLYRVWQAYNAQVGAGDTVYRLQNDFLVVLPIIDPDPSSLTCHEITSPYVSIISPGSVHITWDSNDYQIAWEVSYCPEGVSPDAGTIIYCTSPSCDITVPDLTTSWKVYVRGVCSYCNGLHTVYGDWNQGSYIYRYHPQDPEDPEDPEEGIGDTPNSDGNNLTLHPNPAKDQVQLLSAYELSKVEIADGLGRIILSLPAEGHSSVIDISPLPKGSYVVMAYSSLGISTQRLLVE